MCLQFWDISISKKAANLPHILSYFSGDICGRRFSSPYFFPRIRGNVYTLNNGSAAKYPIQVTVQFHGSDQGGGGRGSRLHGFAAEQTTAETRLVDTWPPVTSRHRCWRQVTCIKHCPRQRPGTSPVPVSDNEAVGTRANGPRASTRFVNEVLYCWTIEHV